ncbi:MAG TPA: hypothetical protein DFI00_01465 [Rhodospirillaceae bacterium]|nr:hypothetical protein [Alphaproteobacteria bacterium]OUT42361.1 MAG: hypothetical protein CBB62_08785 [Micavibrio sp. TMED2]HCI45941.1 hypothetical protein [Rhodospirillaceae bacterium]MAS46004.1 hypothetical protein [Alphaproteobacteria bacterium]MAX95814.1 hypothetical protein [Alphaproteobacteria bacterium]|tara:strand:- start:7058 stop:7300 length:243 start_codon:yes stop_codon:yes gene_type:complete
MEQQSGGNWWDSAFSTVTGLFDRWLDYEQVSNQGDLAFQAQSQQPAIDYSTAVQAQQSQATMNYILIGGAAIAALLLIRR